MLNDDVLEYFDKLHLPYSRLLEVGRGRHKLSQFSVEAGMMRIFEQRGSFPRISIGHRVFLEARTVTPPSPEEIPKRSWRVRWSESRIRSFLKDWVF